MKIASRIFPLLAFLALALVASPAQAEPENPIISGNISVEVIGGGTVTGNGISCGSDCSDSAAWRENEMPPVNRLTATPGGGWAFTEWTGCTPVSGSIPRCDAHYGTEDPTQVTARFVDVQAPSVTIQTPTDGARGGDSLAASVATSDNDRVTRVEYLIDGQVVRNVTAPYTTVLDLTGVSEGVHTLQARAYDPAGNRGDSTQRSITVDHTGPNVTLTAPLPATNSTRPEFSFSSSSGDLVRADCAIRKTGTDGTFKACVSGQWFSDSTPDEGAWQFVVWAVDDVGNATLVTHDFIVDRVAPVAAFTSGPVDGSVVEVGNVKYEWTVTDQLAVTQECVWDNGETTACDGSAARGLTAGPHSFKVVFTDLAGNKNVLARTFTVKRAGNTPDPDPRPDPDPKPDPDTSDRTAPVIKLVAPRQKLVGLRKALKLNVRCSEACVGQIVVKGGGVRFAGRVNLTDAGVAKLKLRPTAQVRRKVAAIRARGPKARLLKLVATADLKDRAGNGGRASLKLRVKD